MKKILITVTVLAVAAIIGFISFMSFGGKALITGYSLRCDNGSYMIIEENGSPIRYSFDKALGTDTESLEQGDRILIISDLINESYPGSTRAYFIFKLSDGDVEDIPAETLSQLSELGWYKE